MAVTVFAANQFEIAFETLVFFAFPVEIHADYNVFELEDAFERCGFKYYFCGYLSPFHTTEPSGSGGSLLSFDEAVLQAELSVEGETKFFRFHYAHMGRTVLFENLFDIGCNIVYFLVFGQT